MCTVKKISYREKNNFYNPVLLTPSKREIDTSVQIIIINQVDGYSSQAFVSLHPCPLYKGKHCFIMNAP